MDVENKGVMDFDDFSVFIRQLRLRPEITRLFKKYATSNSAYLSPEEFLKFMHKQQKVSLFFFLREGCTGTNKTKLKTKRKKR